MLPSVRIFVPTFSFSQGRAFTSMSQTPISIIGAGIGGLALGRCLLKHGIPAVLYDKSQSKPRHNYGITLHPSSYQPLCKSLDVDETTFLQRIAVDSAVGGSGVIDPDAAVHSSGLQSPSFRANRAQLEQFLREGLDIKWEYAVEKIEEASDGMSMCFQDGQTLNSTCIIGADGPHSKIRNSLLPDTQLSVLPYVAFNGKRRLQRALFDELYAPTMKDSSIIEMRRNNAVLHVSINEKLDDLVSISWIYSRPARGSSDPLHKPNRPASGATDIPKEFLEEISELQNLAQPFKDVFDEQKLKNERVLHWLMRNVLVNSSDLKALGENNVYFIGDAVHAEAVLGGEGANRAIQDGIELAQYIAINGTANLSTWYDSRFPIWKHGLTRSERAIAQMHEVEKACL